MVINIASSQRLLLFFLHNPGWLRYLPEWRKTIAIKKKQPLANALDYELLWVTYGAADKIKKYLKPDMRVYEYSSGGSTLFFAKRVRQVISVEHDRDWYSGTLRKIRANHITNSQLHLVEPEIKTEGQTEYVSQTFPQYKNSSFEKYVKFIRNYPDAFFDLVLIDGRSRPFCVYESVVKVRPGGYLVLDNSDRNHYQEAITSLNKYKRWDYPGFGPFDEAFWQTTIWQIG